MSDVTYSLLDTENAQEAQDVKRLVDKDISEPYSIYVYRFFLSQWPNLCILAKVDGETVGTIIAKLEPHRNVRLRGYIGMVVVEKEHRKKGIARRLVNMVIEEMIKKNADEITLETEVVNKAAIKLYENIGFLRTKRLHRYYMNQHDAFRLVLPITDRSLTRSAFLPPLD